MSWLQRADRPVHLRIEFTQKDKGHVQVFVVPFRIVSIKLVGLLVVDGEEIGAEINSLRAEQRPYRESETRGCDYRIGAPLLVELD